MNSAEKPGLTRLLRPISKQKNLTDVANNYLNYYGESKVEACEKNKVADSNEVAATYYDIATDFFEYGWGEGFHFATINKGESREHAFARHEYKLALKLGLKKGDRVLDIGCGVGGPGRHIATFSEAKVIGLNINEYQIKRAKSLTKKVGLEHLCEYVKGDFCNMPFPDESFTRVYAIEATCHASDDLSRVYADVYRILKPGGLFAFYEWIMTDKYDPENPYHQKIKNEILIGDGLPDLVTKETVHECLKKVGFEVLEAEDLALNSPVPWYSTLQPSWNLSDFKITPLGRWATHIMLALMETFRLAPRGSCKIHRTLCRGADGLVLGGKEGIFSPMYLVVAKKPERDS